MSVKFRASFLGPLAAPLVAAVLSACSKPADPLPGTSEGTFNVVGTLGTNTCGTALGLVNPWNFQIQMSEDGTTLYFAGTAGSGAVSGPLNGNSAVLTSTTTVNVDTSDAAAGVCGLTQTATFTFDLDSATSPTSFTGSATYTYAMPTGVTSTVICTDQLASSGGAYATLPCSFTYSLTGSH